MGSLIKKLDASKTDQRNNVTTSVFKIFAIFSDELHRNINNCISESLFPDDLKSADVVSICETVKKDSKNLKSIHTSKYTSKYF